MLPGPFLKTWIPQLPSTGPLPTIHRNLSIIPLSTHLDLGFQLGGQNIFEFLFCDFYSQLFIFLLSISLGNNLWDFSYISPSLILELGFEIFSSFISYVIERSCHRTIFFLDFLNCVNVSLVLCIILKEFGIFISLSQPNSSGFQPTFCLFFF